jgi:hypothetical protein
MNKLTFYRQWQNLLSEKLNLFNYLRISRVGSALRAIAFVWMLHPVLSTAQVNRYEQGGQDSWSYSILFQPGATSAQEVAAVNAFIKEIVTNNKHRFPTLFPKVYVCPCDSSLWDIDFKILGGAGNVVNNPPPPPPPPPGGNGGGLPHVAFVKLNNPVLDNESDSFPSFGHYRAPIPNKQIDKKSILAVIDTGIDTTKFDPNIRSLLWKDPGAPTLYNFLPGANTATFKDDNDARHGTTVTALALQGMQHTPVYPAIMVLKALDGNKTGSTFSVSCALSYAIKHHAKLINASLGYYSRGPQDSILREYLKRCANATDPIPVVVSAGNTNGHHAINLLCQPNANNLLQNGHLFFPACFSLQFSNVISVTGLARPKQPCFYQNYSPQFITLGVIPAANAFSSTAISTCCTYFVPFVPQFHEGSSFATPIFAGKLMDLILRGQPKAPFLPYVQQLIGHNRSPLTKMGFITY